MYITNSIDGKYALHQRSFATLHILHHMLLKTLSGSRQARIARNSIIIAALLATVFIRPESDFYSGMVAGTRLGLIILVMLIVTRRVGDRDNRL